MKDNTESRININESNMYITGMRETGAYPEEGYLRPSPGEGLPGNYLQVTEDNVQQILESSLKALERLEQTLRTNPQARPATLEDRIKILETDEQALGKGNPNLKVRYDEIAKACWMSGNYKQALDYLLKALAIEEEALRQDHPDLSNRYHAVATFYEKLGDNQQTLEYFLKGLKIEEQTLDKIILIYR